MQGLSLLFNQMRVDGVAGLIVDCNVNSISGDLCFQAGLVVIDEDREVVAHLAGLVELIFVQVRTYHKIDAALVENRHEIMVHPSMYDIIVRHARVYHRDVQKANPYLG